MPLIKIERIREHTHWPKQYTICINDVEVESIGNNEAKEVTVGSGEHSIYIKMGLNRSEMLSFTINENETKSYRVGVAESVKNSTSLGRILYCVMAASVPFATRNGSIIVLFFILIIMLFAYAFTLKNEYFSLVEIVE